MASERPDTRAIEVSSFQSTLASRLRQGKFDFACQSMRSGKFAAGRTVDSEKPRPAPAGASPSSCTPAVFLAPSEITAVLTKHVYAGRSLPSARVVEWGNACHHLSEIMLGQDNVYRRQQPVTADTESVCRDDHLTARSPAVAVGQRVTFLRKFLYRFTMTMFWINGKIFDIVAQLSILRQAIAPSWLPNARQSPADCG